MAGIDKAMQGSVKARQQGLRAVWQALQTWTMRRRARSALARLDPHMLRDIGLTRTAAAQECDKPFWTE
jgi:uncharacterized protein YjiS (DUF1127 family)